MMQWSIRFSLPLLLFFLFSSYLSAKSLDKLYSIKAKEGESLRHLLEKRIGIPKSLLYKKGYYKKIRKKNSSIKNVNSLKAGTKVFVIIPSDTILKREKEKEHYPWKFSLFYMLSNGQMQEAIKDSNVVASSTQDSPLTLGLSVFKKIEKNYNFSGSFYLSQLDGAITERNESIQIPPEYGITSYIGMFKKDWPLEVYTGIDYERLSSYNTEEVELGASLDTRQHMLAFWTLGVSKIFKSFGKQFLAKVSYSLVFLSTQSRPSTVDSSTFKGTKFMLYLNMKGENGWFYHGFYKQHDLEGATLLHFSRLGIGFGYSF